MFSIVNKSWQIFISLSCSKKKKTNRLRLSVVCTLIDNDTGHHSGQNLFMHVDISKVLTGIQMVS